MSKIQKVAVTDARLMQDEPAYAVQKGALSISVAPFQAIAASQSQMTFQVLVPSLNVFIDRKIVISTPLSFNANVFYGGARGPGYKQLYVGYGTGFTLNTNSIATAAFSKSGVNLTLGGTLDTEVAVINTYITAKNFPTLAGNGFSPSSIVTAIALGAGSGQVTITFQPPAQYTSAAAGFLLLLPASFDVPDPAMGIAGVAQTLGCDNGQSLPFSFPGVASGFCSAVSGKDLSLTSFPIQSCLTNMTATLNDCTVTTNGDTLREQLMLTQYRDNMKQRTTPSNPDMFSWGRDDVQNGCGNFSTYGVTNSYGDIPNGAWPIAWNSDAKCAAPLQALASGALAPVGTGTIPGWPFLASGGVYSFLPTAATGASITGGVSSGSAASGGVGFYVAPVSTSVISSVTSISGLALVPFVNYQPVWTTGFPGGDIYGGSGAENTTLQAGAVSFTISGTTLTLNISVPPMSMLGARLYDGLAGNYSVTAVPSATGVANTSATGCIAICSQLITGQLGAPGSTYALTFGQVATSSPSFITNGVNPTGKVYALSGGCPAGLSLPVYGSIACAEALVISPLIWADSAEFQSVGLYGMTNMQFVLNFSTLGTTLALVNPAVSVTGVASRSTSSQPLYIDNLSQSNSNTGNILRSSNIRSVISDVKYAATAGNQGPWAAGSSLILPTSSAVPTLYATFLTPGVDVPLPDVSTVPYVEFPRYFYQTGSAIGAQSKPTLISQTISLTSIPDMVMIYVKPNTRGPSQLDQYIPINGVSVTFDNFSNLCSNFQQTHLYECAVAAGLDMDWHQWRGFTQAQCPSGVLPTTAAIAPYSTYTQQSPFTQLSGGPILLRMGQDITLQPGLAPGCLGNYSFQVTVTMDNSKGYYNYVTNPVITIIAINTGFFETMRGQSAIRKTILQMADVAAATTDSGMSKTHLNRMVGRGNFFSGASNLVHRGLSAVKAAKGINDKYHLSDLARTYGGATGSQVADMAERGMDMGARAHDSLYGGAKRHRPSGL